MPPESSPSRRLPEPRTRGLRDSAMNRRTFLHRAAGAAAASIAPAALSRAVQSGTEPEFRISLAQWSLHRTIRGGKLDPMEFPHAARRRYGLDAVEYVNQFYMDKKSQGDYWRELKRRCDDVEVKSLLIMCDGEGALGDADDARRTTAIEKHFAWVEIARQLGCHSVRVNAESTGSAEEQRRLAADGLRRLAEFAAERDIHVLVENHGGLSSNGAWLASVMRAVDHPRCGTLPDFGNFLIGRRADGTEEWYDRYQGVKELMPFARAVSAKSHDFDADGNETRTDYRRMMGLVLAAGYRGHVGIEYEGERLSEDAGIQATRDLLLRVRSERGGAADAGE